LLLCGYPAAAQTGVLVCHAWHKPEHTAFGSSSFLNFYDLLSTN